MIHLIAISPVIASPGLAELGYLAIRSPSQRRETKALSFPKGIHPEGLFLKEGERDFKRVAISSLSRYSIGAGAGKLDPRPAACCGSRLLHKIGDYAGPYYARGSNTAAAVLRVP